MKRFANYDEGDGAAQLRETRITSVRLQKATTNSTQCGVAESIHFYSILQLSLTCCYFRYQSLLRFVQAKLVFAFSRETLRYSAAD